MRQVTGSMAGVVRGMEGAMKAMDLEKVRIGNKIVFTLSRSVGLTVFVRKKFRSPR